MGLPEASPADAPQGRAAVGKDHRCQGNKKTPIQPQIWLRCKRIDKSRTEKILPASDGRYKETDAKSREQRAKEGSACRKLNMT